MTRVSRRLLGFALLATLGALESVPRTAAAQETIERPEVVQAMELENAGKYREAAALFRTSIRSAPTPGAVLGLERVYAELGFSDSLLAPLDSVIARQPREPVYRTVQLRTLQILRKDDRMREAFEKWVRAVPRDPAPYREYARALLQMGKAASADSIVARGRVALGGTRELEYENAQARAAMGEWVASAQSWRRALIDAPHLASAASYALAPTPNALRNDVRLALGAQPPAAGPQHALAELELGWGRPQEAWDALRVLRADTASAALWEEFGDRAAGDERWTVANEAYVAALGVHRTTSLASRAANSALRAGHPDAVFTLAPLNDASDDSGRVVREFLPLHVAALAQLGRAREADALVVKYDRLLAPAQRMRLAQDVATAWVRAGDLAHARAALHAAGADADSSEAAGWLALYEGRLDAARTLLKSSREPSGDLAIAMGLIARTKGDSAPALGAAFLALARHDSAAASRAFADAATSHPEVAAALLLQGARVRAGHDDDAITLWSRVVAEHPDAPEAAESELEWARALRRHGDNAGAVTHLEHLILSAPQSALLPQARRELEQARGAVPSP